MMKRAFTRVCAIGLACAGLIAVTQRAGRAQTQAPSLGTASDFSTSEYFDPPYHTQMKWLITGAEARPQSGGKVLISQVKLQKFREDGECEMIVDAPECVYDSAQRSASSPGPLQMHSGDGRFFVEGEGFLLQQAERSLTVSNEVRSGSLTISNRVRTIIKQQTQTKKK